MACFTGSFAGTIIFDVVGICCMLAGDMARLGRDLTLVMDRSFRESFGETRSSFPEVPMEKWLRIELVLMFSGEV